MHSYCKACLDTHSCGAATFPCPGKNKKESEKQTHKAKQSSKSLFQLHPAPSSSHKQLTRCLPTVTSPPSPPSTWPKPPTPSQSPPAAHNIGSQHLPSCVAPRPIMDPGSCRRPLMRVWHQTGEAAWSTEGPWSNSRLLPGIPSTMAYQAVTPGNP